MPGEIQHSETVGDQCVIIGWVMDPTHHWHPVVLHRCA